jgi:DNA polymerase III subunit delta'
MLFKEIIGQEKSKRHLIQTVKDNRVSHAQLFLGPEGSGKLALAIAYAQYISCTNRQPDDSCGVCPSCVKYSKLVHPDLQFLYPIGTVKEKPLSMHFLKEWRQLLEEKDQYISLQHWYEALGLDNKQGLINAANCNEVIRLLGLKSYESEYKVVIIWLVEKLFHAAAPKLLKILEEPPDKTLFILISENHDQILNTIASRAQIFKIPKISDKELYQALVTKYGIAQAVAKSTIPIANGNMVEAVDIAENLDEEGRQVQKFREWMLMCYSSQYAELIPWIDEVSKTGRERIKRFLYVGLEVIRGSIMVNFGADKLIRTEEENHDFIKKFAKMLNPANSAQMVEELNTAIFHVERNGNPKVIFLDLSLKVKKLINPKNG